MPKKRGYRKKRIVRRRRPQRARKGGRIQTLKLKTPGVICPDRYMVKLRYIDEHSSVLATPGTFYGYLRYYMNAVYDANPLVLTAPLEGFTQLAALYDNYRVNGSKVNLLISNMENFPVMVVLIPTNIDLATVLGTANNVRSLIGNPYCKFKCISAKGGVDKCSLKSFVTCKKILGSTETKYDTLYSGSSNTNPSRLLYWNVACYALGGQAFTAAGVLFETRVTYYTQFYNRKPLI